MAFRVSGVVRAGWQRFSNNSRLKDTVSRVAENKLESAGLGVAFGGLALAGLGLWKERQRRPVDGRLSDEDWEEIQAIGGQD